MLQTACGNRTTQPYAPTYHNSKYSFFFFFLGIKNLSTLQDLPWVCIGDFNEVLNLSEHDGVGCRSQAQIDGFREAVDTCGLLDIGYTGTSWTFEKKVAGGTYTRVRLNRCLANPEWLLALPYSTLHHKTAAGSDHCPILLTLRNIHACRAGPRSFKYETMWEREESLFTMVAGIWSMQDGGDVHSLHGKLGDLAGD